MNREVHLVSAEVDSDWKDIRAAVDGDDEAYARLVRRHQNRIFKQMWRFTRDRAEQEELVQETFVEAFMSLGRYKGTAPFLHWLSKIASRVGYRYWKKKEREQHVKQAVLEHYSVYPFPTQHGAVEAAECLHKLLGYIKPKDRLILTMFYFESMDGEEIAEHMGWSANLVRVRLHRARNKLAKVLCEQHIEVNAA